jgi:hypothetical protein
MKYIKKLCLCIVTLVSFSSLGMIRQVIRDEHGFRVFDGQQEHMVKPYFIDSLLKRMNPEQIQRFIEHGNHIRAIRLSNGEYRLQAMVPVKGGGPISGAIAYWVVKSLCYGTAVVAAGTVVVATGGAAGAAVGAVAAASTLGAGAGATVVGGAIAGAGLAGEAMTATTCCSCMCRRYSRAVAAVESASMAAWAAATLCPFLP